MSFSIKPSELPFCSGVWNEKKQIYETDNSMGVIDCCLENCKKSIAFCTETDKNCQELLDNCRITCLDYNSKGIEVLSKCIEDRKCGEYPYVNKNCMKEKEDDIKACCYDECVLELQENCKEQCDLFYNRIAKGVDSILTLPKNEEVSFSSKKELNMNPIFLILFLSLLVLVFKIVA